MPQHISQSIIDQSHQYRVYIFIFLEKYFFKKPKYDVATFLSTVTSITGGTFETFNITKIKVILCYKYPLKSYSCNANLELCIRRFKTVLEGLICQLH